MLSVASILCAVSLIQHSAHISGFIPSNHKQLRPKNKRFYVNSRNEDHSDSFSPTRRNLLLTSVLFPSINVIFTPKQSNAIEEDSLKLGTRTFRAVTQSDLGISVRKSVVRGAQVVDKIDQKWEQMSDTFGLGSERSRRDKRPEPKIIPPPLPLNEKIAMEILSISDEVRFLSEC